MKYLTSIYVPKTMITKTGFDIDNFIKENGIIPIISEDTGDDHFISFDAELIPIPNGVSFMQVSEDGKVYQTNNPTKFPDKYLLDYVTDGYHVKDTAKDWTEVAQDVYVNFGFRPKDLEDLNTRLSGVICTEVTIVK